MRLFSDDEQLLSKLSEKGNPLERLDKVMDWNQSRPILNRIFGNAQKIASKSGRPPHDFLMMFKILLLQRLHNLSDDAMEYQLLDRLSFRRFVGCDERKVPDAKTIWLYRERLSKSGKEQELFDQFYFTLTQEGLLAHKGQIVDASFVETPKQRNSREENKQIKNGEITEDWDKRKKSQKDTDTRWTKKGDSLTLAIKIISALIANPSSSRISKSPLLKSMIPIFQPNSVVQMSLSLMTVCMSWKSLHLLITMLRTVLLVDRKWESTTSKKRLKSPT